MEWFAKTYLKDVRAKILDIGSYDVNGNYRDIFIDERFEYTGLDMEDGPNVILCHIHLINGVKLKMIAMMLLFLGKH